MGILGYVGSLVISDVCEHNCYCIWAKKSTRASRFWCHAIAVVFTNVRKLRVQPGSAFRVVDKVVRYRERQILVA